ncbi:hypothetical protein BSBH6_00866 [Bacillus subtilis]|nr:hypothetical protein BSBH6_00866 [Bacillus subtilis]RPK27227.1 hypothetical protein BH5_00863 [Bacillus subtilis]
MEGGISQWVNEANPEGLFSRVKTPSGYTPQDFHIGLH